MKHLIPALALLFLFACGDDDAPVTDGGTDGGSDGGGGSDSGVDAGTDAPVGDDAGTGCTQVTASMPTLAYGDDVSIAFALRVTPVPPDASTEMLLLFERYVPGPDVGTFELGAGGDDANFGNCRHCVVLPGLSATRGFFADRGTLVTRADPYARRLDARVTNLRLIEVEIDGETRESTPIPGGRCVEIADFEAQGTFPPEAWVCDDAQYGDGATCNCECGDFDPDCAVDTECPPFDPGCEPAFEPLPTDCNAGDVCVFDPVFGSPRCAATCDHAARTPCDEGVCVFDFVGDGVDTCWVEDDRIARVPPGEPCGSAGIQKVCHVVDGVARGFCGYDDVCRPLCGEGELACTVEGESCMTFFLEGDLGFCSGPFVDG